MRKAELPALTGIRFYAALLVYLSHISAIPGMEGLSGELRIFNVGVVGVAVFFALSGFILTYNYSDMLRERVSAKTYARFVWDRLARIYPVHFVMLLFMIPVQAYSPNLPLDWRAVPFHLFLLQCFWPFSHPTFFNYLNVPSWSISCEWFFYLLAPAAIFLAWQRRGRWLLLSALIVYATTMGCFLLHQPEYTQLYLISWFAPSRIFEFVAGIFLALLYFKTANSRPAWCSVVAQLAGVILIVTGAIYRPYSPWPFHGGLLYLPGSLLLILGLADGRGFFARHLGSKMLSRLGLASFSFYLIHAPIIRVCRGCCLKLGWEVHSWTIFSLVAIGLFAVIQTIALFVHSYYEMPMLRRLRRLFPATEAGGLIPVAVRAGTTTSFSG